jgi:hypothetical protein
LNHLLLAVDLNPACLFGKPAVGWLHVQCLSQLDVTSSTCPVLEATELGLNGLIHLASGSVYEALFLELHDLSLQISLQLVLLEHVRAGSGSSSEYCSSGALALLLSYAWNP